jgi:hypothetical protein
VVSRTVGIRVEDEEFEAVRKRRNAKAATGAPEPISERDTQPRRQRHNGHSVPLDQRIPIQTVGIHSRRSLESHGDVAGVPATLRRGHVYDQAPVEGLERQKRSDERTVVASHVKDVAPENGSTTSRHAERNDVVDALRALQSIGDLVSY